MADTVAVVVQPGGGDVLQFLKSGIMEIPDVLVVTKADLGQIALRAQARPERRAALARLGAARGVAVSSLPPPSGIEELVEALEEHRARLDIAARRLRARRAGALADFVAEHGERGAARARRPPRGGALARRRRTRRSTRPRSWRRSSSARWPA